jgi:hypothetical protein
VEGPKNWDRARRFTHLSKSRILHCVMRLQNNKGSQKELQSELKNAKESNCRTSSSGS